MTARCATRPCCWPGSPSRPPAVTYGAARLTAGRILRPIADLTAAAEHVSRTRDLTARRRVHRDHR